MAAVGKAEVLRHRDVEGDSTTETFCALRLEVEKWRRAGVPLFIRTGKLLPVTQPEVRLVFKPSPNLGFGLRDAESQPDQLVMRLDPSTGMRILLNAQRADAAKPSLVPLDMEFATEGGEGPTPYEVLLLAAPRGGRARFGRQETIEEAWRTRQPLIDHPSPFKSYSPGTWERSRWTRCRRLRRLARALGLIRQLARAGVRASSTSRQPQPALGCALGNLPVSVRRSPDTRAARTFIAWSHRTRGKGIHYVHTDAAGCTRCRSGELSRYSNDGWCRPGILRSR